VAAYVLTDSAVIEALRDASARGVKARVKVRIWRDGSGAARHLQPGGETLYAARVPLSFWTVPTPTP
jgi:hypothetical protein